MEKLKMHTPDLAEENYKKLAALFPNAVTETMDEGGNVVRAIDKDVLMQEINAKVVDDGQERYQFTWPDKRKAVILANQPIAKTLRFEKAKSVGRDGTPGGTDSENIYIEGDNLDALKLLQETYLGKVKMIYIDPPYNTGNDFIYEDNFSQTTNEYLRNSGQTDYDGNRLVKNSESNGRFHTDWLNMIYSRLKLAKDMLADNGVIFISIDDNEQQNLKKVCDEIFGDNNFIAQFVWEKKKKPSFLNANLGTKTEYIMCYSKKRSLTGAFSVSVTEEGKKYPFNNAGNSINTLIFPPNSVSFGISDGIVHPQDMSEGNIITRLLTDVEIKQGKNVNEFKLEGEWRYSQKKLDEIVANNEKIIISKIPFRPNHIKKGGEIKKIHNLLAISTYNVGTNEDATKEQTELMGKAYFDYSKPTGLLKFLIKSASYNESNCIIMDFFSGTATTAEAILLLNSEDAMNRKFIMVQLPEKTDLAGEAYRDGYHNICDIGEERIRRAGKKIKKETGADIDYGFRCFKIDSSNMKDVYYKPAEVKQAEIDLFADNIKADRTPEDLLIQVMLDLGVLLSSKVERTEIAGKKVFSVADGYLIACFDDEVTEEVVTAIAKKKPFYAVFRDSSMADDSVAANFEQIFATYSPQTVRKVL
ncbi:MAG: Type III restriction-modification system methyltransferase [Succiniclasticum sp.]|jgi:adenine-specific DNA-methyltransferase